MHPKLSTWQTEDLLQRNAMIESQWLMVRINVSPSTFVWASRPGSMSPGNKWDSCVQKELM